MRKANQLTRTKPREAAVRVACTASALSLKRPRLFKRRVPCWAQLGPNQPGNTSFRFFMYPPEHFSMYSGCDRLHHPSAKHSVALLLVKALAHHPWRTWDMRAACVFVVPALVDWMVDGLCPTYSDDEHIENLTRIVWPFLHAGRHIFIAATWNQATCSEAHTMTAPLSPKPHYYV